LRKSLVACHYGLSTKAAIGEHGRFLYPVAGAGCYRAVRTTNASVFSS
jgi:hypothetical protein